MQDVTFRLNCDGSQGMGALSTFQGKLKEVGNTARGELAQHLKTVFTVGAIEETIRRTAEWATAIEQTSKQLGISAEAMQTLNVMAQKQGLPSDAMQGLFENVAKAQQDAVNGNIELQWSFQQLGITMTQLQHMNKADLFSAVMHGLPTDVINSGIVMRNVAKNVTGGTPENYINAAKSELGNNTFGQYTNEQKANGAIQPEQNINELSATWASFKQILAALGTELAEPVSVLVSLLNTLALGLKGFVDMFTALISGEWSKAGAIFVAMGEGLVLTLTGLVDTIANGINKALSHLPVIGKYFGGVSNTTGAMEEYFNKDSNDQNTKEGRALGESATILFPIGGELGAGAKALKGSATRVLEKTGIKQAADAGASVLPTADDIGAILDQRELDVKKEADAIAKEQGITNSEFPGQFRKNNQLMTPEESQMLQSNFKTDAEKRYVNKQIKIMNDTVNARRAKGYMSANTGLSVGIAGLVASKPEAGKGPQDTTPILPMSQFQNMSGGRTSTLSMGGVFGSGFQSRIIQLNGQMVAYLAQITKYLAPGTTPPTGQNPNSQGATNY